VRAAIDSIGKLPGLRQEGGFTLLELLVVMVLMALVTGVVAPRIANVLPGAQFKQTAREMTITLRQARQQAMTRGREAIVRFDLAARSYGPSPSGASRSWGERMALEVQVPESQMRVAEQPSIVFYPDGSSSGARIELAQGGRRMAIQVDWLAGSVTVL